MSENIENTNKNLTFEDFKNENGLTYWWASDLMKMLGYANMRSFQKVLDRTTKALVSLDISHYENILVESREVDGQKIQDFKLTRFACYMTVMNGDPKKVEVAKAQSYFAQQTRKFELHIRDHTQIDRLLIRGELTEGHKSLASTAKQAEVTNYARFQNEGYLGMYNMKSWELEKRRNIKKGKLMDNMGRTELAANLFRITQTEEKIKRKNIKGQNNLEQTHHQVGKAVRNLVKENVGKNPENLPQEKNLPEVQKELKIGYKKMKSQDKKDDTKKIKELTLF